MMHLQHFAAQARFVPSGGIKGTRLCLITDHLRRSSLYSQHSSQRLTMSSQSRTSQNVSGDNPSVQP